jgi:glycerol-3-phosphate acyltransferase PlsX
MRIVIDGLGSDRAPGPEIRGVVEAARAGQCEIILVGPEDDMKKRLAGFKKAGNVRIVHAPYRIEMHDNPLSAVRQKRDSSLHVGLRLIKQGEADAFVSAGNTGAVMLAARTILRPIPGVARSAVCQILPTKKNPVVMLDLGANVDCTAKHLCQFAEMGTVFCRDMLGVKSPRVGQLNIGEEQLKGTDLSKTVHTHLKAATHINFIGNVEPKAVFEGEADVVICDGFVGNVMLKTSEGVASLIATLLKRELNRSWLSQVGAIFSIGAHRRLKRIIDPNEHPGALLLGVQGTVIILHGSSTAMGIKNGILGACLAVERDVNEHIRLGIEELRQTEDKFEEEATEK